MNDSDDLLDLIKSLSRSEKRYFKLYASTHKNESRVVRLFDVLEKKERYDIKGNDPVFKKGTLPVIKNHLYKLILKSMYAYRSESSVKLKLKESIAHIDFLSQKGLFSQSVKMIEKAKHLARKYDYPLEMMELIDMSMLTASQQWFRKAASEDIDKMLHDMINSTEEWKAYAEYEAIGYKISLAISKKGFRTDNDTRKYEDEIKKMLIQLKKNKQMPFRTQFAICITACAWYYNFKKSREAYSVMIHLTSVFESNAHYIQNFPSMYMVCIGNLMNCQIALKKYKGLERSISNLDRVPIASESIKTRIFFYRYTVRLALCKYTGDMNKGMKWVEEIEKKHLAELKGLDSKPRVHLCFEIACTYFGAGNYLSTKKYLREIINTTGDTRDDIQCFARLLNLIVYYETGEQEMLEYAARSVYRFLLKREGIFKMENLLLKFLRNKAPKINSKKERADAFTELKKELEKVIKDPYEASTMLAFDLISWLHSKISGQPFSKIVREKARVEGR